MTHGDLYHAIAADFRQDPEKTLAALTVEDLTEILITRERIDLMVTALRLCQEHAFFGKFPNDELVWEAIDAALTDEKEKA